MLSARHSPTARAIDARVRLHVALFFVLADEMLQAAALAKNPDIIVATPGRLLYHLQNSSIVNLKAVKYLVNMEQRTRETKNEKTKTKKININVSHPKQVFVAVSASLV